MSQASRSFERREKRKCRSKIRYEEWHQVDRVCRLNTLKNGQRFLEGYECRWCFGLHLRTKLEVPQELKVTLDRAGVVT